MPTLSLQALRQAAATVAPSRLPALGRAAAEIVQAAYREVAGG